MSTHTLSIPDLSCGHCVAAVTTAVRSAPSASDCRVDLARKRALVTLSDDAQLPEVLRRLDDAGYPATTVVEG